MGYPLISEGCPPTEGEMGFILFSTKRYKWILYIFYQPNVPTEHFTNIKIRSVRTFSR